MPRYSLRTLLILLAIGPPLVAAEPSGAAKQKLQKLQGDWVLVYWRFDGKDEDATSKKTVTTYTDNRFSIRIGNKLHESGTITLDPATSPMRLDHILNSLASSDRKPIEMTLPGICLLQDDILMLCIDYGGKRPQTFSADAGSWKELFIYRRMKK